MDNTSRPYQDELLQALTHPDEAAAYLNAALEDGSSDVFMLALHNVAQAQALRAGAAIASIESATLPKLFAQAGLRFAANETEESLIERRLR